MKLRIKILSVREEAKLSDDELISYYERKRTYYKNAPVNNFYLGFVKAIRKILIKVAAKTKNYELVYLNDSDYPKDGCIIATNHKGFNDLPILLEAVPESFHFFAANDVPMPTGIKFLFMLLGAISFDRNNKDEKQWGLDRMSKICARGHFGAIYPEAVNNFKESLPLFHFWPGVIDIAKNSGKPILPIATFDTEKTVYVKYGKLFEVNACDDRNNAAADLRDIVTTLLWDIWETFPTITRNEAIETYVKPNLVGAITYRTEYEMQFVYRPVNPHSPTGEREISYYDVIDIRRNIQIAKRVSSYDMEVNDYKDFCIKAARKELYGI